MRKPVHIVQFIVDRIIKTDNPPPITVNRKTSGFTLVELMVVMGIFALMLGFTSINLIRPQTQANLDTTVTTLVSDLKQQQIRAMSGDGPSAYGVYLEPNRYTLFTGSIYSAGATDNFSINMDGGVTLSPTTQIVFAQRSGETSTTTITVTNTNSNQTKTITINQYGAALVQ